MYNISNYTCDGIGDQLRLGPIIRHTKLNKLDMVKVKCNIVAETSLKYNEYNENSDTYLRLF